VLIDIGDIAHYSGVGETKGATRMYLLIDKHKLFFETLGFMLKIKKGESFTHIESSNNLLQLLQDISPKLIIMDFIHKDRTALSAIKSLARNNISIPIILICESSLAMKTVLQENAVSIVHKKSCIQTLLKAIDISLNGRQFIDPKFIGLITSNKHNMPKLSLRELEVVTYLLQGISPINIAGKLFISPKTVRAHKANIMSKIDAQSDIDLLLFGLHHKLLQTELVL